MNTLIAELSTFDRMDSLFVSTLNARNAVIDQLIERGYLAVWRMIEGVGRLIEITAAGRDALMAQVSMAFLSEDEKAIVSAMAHHTHEWMLIWHDYSEKNKMVFGLIEKGIFNLESNTPECFFISLAHKGVTCL